MKYLILGLILLLLAIGLGLEMAHGTGYVLIMYRHTSIETSLWVALLSLFIAFIAFYFVFRLLGSTLRISKKIRLWKKHHQQRKAKRLTHRGLCQLVEGYWMEAEQTLIQAAKIAYPSLIHYLAAAYAAQAQKSYEHRDLYLRQAHLANKACTLAVSLTQAQLQMQAHQWEQALATLKHLYHHCPHHPPVLKGLERVYQQLKDWESSKKLLPALRKYHVLSDHELRTIEESIYLAELKQASHQKIERLIETWQALPKQWRHDLFILRAYTRYLIQHHEDETAIELIENVLKKQWDAILVENYSRAYGKNGAKQLSTAETWFKHYPKEPTLLLCLGELSRREKFWGKARDYLEASLSLAPSSQAYETLGMVLEASGDIPAALDMYRKGLAFNLALRG
ncbi:MAG: hypothetical protein A3F41_05325 [Coxiella sp. RIFCSPHIGHO2_12_FULL_44_14]|nr:MAG: hypothetical protein A3F41_05325 [Coxiella sp. RIFCSPHIGHO2_12_FULL_44_14]